MERIALLTQINTWLNTRSRSTLEKLERTLYSVRMIPPSSLWTRLDVSSSGMFVVSQRLMIVVDLPQIPSTWISRSLFPLSSPLLQLIRLGQHLLFLLTNSAHTRKVVHYDT